MSTLGISPIAADLRCLSESAKCRFWVASPYIGSWNAVKRVIGTAWQKVDAKLLTDKDSGILARDTIEQFAKHRPIRSLKGLHAKLYIVDDYVLITSANLTAAAFTKRHEAGVILTGELAQRLIRQFDCLWRISKEFDPDEISPPISGPVDEPDHGGALVKLYDLPPVPGGVPETAGDFADYPHFLERYRNFAQVYLSCGEQDAPDQPLFFETDKFLNFLYHGDADTPSQQYKDAKRYRVLSDDERIAEIIKYRKRYREAGFPYLKQNLKSAATIQGYLAPDKVVHLTKTEVEQVALSLNCFGNALARAKFLNNNKPEDVGGAWYDLVHGEGEPKFRMNKCAEALFGFGKSAVQETLGYYDPRKFPLRNLNTNAGLRFLGYAIKN